MQRVQQGQFLRDKGDGDLLTRELFKIIRVELGAEKQRNRCSHVLRQGYGIDKTIGGGAQVLQKGRMGARKARRDVAFVTTKQVTTELRQDFLSISTVFLASSVFWRSSSSSSSKILVLAASVISFDGVVVAFLLRDDMTIH